MRNLFIVISIILILILLKLYFVDWGCSALVEREVFSSVGVRVIQRQQVCHEFGEYMDGDIIVVDDYNNIAKIHDGWVIAQDIRIESELGVLSIYIGKRQNIVIKY